MTQRLLTISAATLAVLTLAACNGAGAPPPPNEMVTQESLPGGEGPNDMTPDAPPE